MNTFLTATIREITKRCLKHLNAAFLLTCCFLLSLYSNPLVGQTTKFIASNAAVQKSITLNFQLDIPTAYKRPNGASFRFERWSWRAGITGAVGSFLGDNQWLYPSVAADVYIYQGGLGSKWPGSLNRAAFYSQWDLDVIINYELTFGIQNRMKTQHMKSPVMRDYPLFYFENNSRPPLQNPFVHSFSLAGNLVWMPTKKGNKFQQVGFLNLHLDRFQFSYYNDGPPFFPPFGDKYDRQYTGGGYISFHGNRNWSFDRFEVGFSKFTGFSKGAYELGNRIGNIYLYHRDSTQQFYNKSRFYFGASGIKNEWRLGGLVTLYDITAFDVQHRIHFTNAYPLHVGTYDGRITVSPTLTYYPYSRIGMQ